MQVYFSFNPPIPAPEGTNIPGLCPVHIHSPSPPASWKTLTRHVLDAKLFCPFVDSLTRNHVAQLNYWAVYRGFTYCWGILEHALFNQRRRLWSRHTKRPFSVTRVAPEALLLMLPFNVWSWWCSFQTRESNTCMRELCREQRNHCTDPCFMAPQLKVSALTVPIRFSAVIC